MGDVFILNDYGKLGKNGDHLLYTNSKGESKKILPFQTDMIVLGGYISITAEGFQILSKNKIPVYFLGRGNNNVRLDYGQGKNVFLRQQQYRVLDSPKGLEFAKSIVLGKVQNQINYLCKKKKYFKDAPINDVLPKLTLLKDDIKNCSQISVLRGYEGIAAKLYFSVFDFLIIPEWAVFGTRSKHPPKTNVNAVLSFIYSILICRVQRTLEALGLDTMASNLHELCYGKDTLAYDLVEEYRTAFADSLCINLFNKGILKESDFEERDGGVFLNENGAAKVVVQIEEKLDSQVLLHRTGEKITYANLFFEQGKHYKNCILGDEPEYIPFEF